MTRRAVFVINLLQDVNIARPLVFMTARDLNLRTELLVTRQFVARDTSGKWQDELREISKRTGASITIFGHHGEALQMLQGEAGVLVAASESDLSAHTPTHDLLRLAPPSILKITLQHGFECVGFLQSHDHDLAHGKNVTFAADVVCGWCDESRLSAMAPSQRGKLYVTGPTTVLQTLVAKQGAKRPSTGLVCENLHSVRLNAAGDFKPEFMKVFDKFCLAIAKEGRAVTLRPHPAGQYVLRHNVQLPSNVKLSNDPIYKTDLTQYAYGISAPSSIVIDMILAGIPVAVWRDASNVMDASNYDGLTEISSLEDWLAFSREAIAHPESFIELQQRFLAHQKMLYEPAEVYRRFARLFTEGVDFPSPLKIGHQPAERIMFVANGQIPTLQLSFLLPLAPLVRDGEIAIDFLLEPQIKETFGKKLRDKSVEPWIAKRLASFRPTLMVFCRYNGPHFEYLIEWARHEGVPAIYHIDDDLLNVPLEIGEEKYKGHNDPRRRASVRYLLDNADLVYTSTNRLAERLKVHGIAGRTFPGRIYCAGKILEPAVNRPVRKIGYMGFDHAHDFSLVLPVIIEFLRRNPAISFELFGSIPKPPELDEFGERVSVLPPVRNYEAFLRALADRSWDIGICPLVKSEFNLLKANTKWVEYTSVGAAVVASRGTVYDECCSDGCGILAGTPEEWLEALNRLTRSPGKRFEQVAKAQAKLAKEYSVEQLRKQVFQVFDRAKTRSREKERILFIANDYGPTLQLSFIKPLAPILESGELTIDVATVGQMKLNSKVGALTHSKDKWIADRLNNFKPTLLVFSRYNGPSIELIMKWAREARVPVLFHIDDDLLSVPREIGLEKYAYHNEPGKLAALRHLLDNSDLVYASTPRLKERFEALDTKAPIVAGEIYCSGRIIVPASERPVRKIGYMASADHAHNLEMILPAIVQLLRRNPNVKFELFGSIPKLEALEKFGDRIVKTRPVADYETFLEKLAKLEWDIGICPLTRINFNLMKANTKWVEYTSVGTAVIASRGTAYDDCCANGCGILATTPAEWLAAFEKLINDPHERFEQVRRAQARLVQEYSVDRLRAQVLDIFERTRSLVGAKLH